MKRREGTVVNSVGGRSLVSLSLSLEHPGRIARDIELGPKMEAATLAEAGYTAGTVVENQVREVGRIRMIQEGPCGRQEGWSFSFEL